MKKILTIFAILALTGITASAQNSKTASKMLYHNGQVLTGVQDAYVIWYGCWNNSNCGPDSDSNTMTIVMNFLASVGNTPYMRINSMYADSLGQPASAALVYGGSVVDSSYSHGVELTDSDIQGIIGEQIRAFRLPQDPQGIYIVVASADVSSVATGFCIQSAPPYHARGIINGGLLHYIFLGHPNRCPTLAGPQFISVGTRLPTPHNSFAGDAMVSNLAHALDGLLTNPHGDGWFDRYGLENADKCQNTFGQTYFTANGARANINLGVSGDFLIQQNWVNDRKPHCAMFQ